MTEAIAGQPGRAHIPDALVRDFDIFAIPGAERDVGAAYREVQRSLPDIFWTPRNGGHWVLTSGEDILHVFQNAKLFSSRHTGLPAAPDDLPPAIPLELDQPDHAFYRRPLVEWLTPWRLRELERDVREVAVETVERLLPRGECEFTSEFSKILPIHIFFRLVDMPLDDKAMLLALVEQSVRDVAEGSRVDAQLQLQAYIGSWVRMRRKAPGDDLLSKIVNVEIRGVRLSETEAINYAALLLSGGLDTIAGMMGFFACFLAQHPEHRRRLVDRIGDRPFVERVVEELLRRHGIANIARVVGSDMDYKGIALKAGDLLMPATPFVGIDERLNPDPLTVDFDRQNPVMATFGRGPHICPGAALARRELRIFLEEWLTRIPDFRIKPGTTPELTTGIINGVTRLELVWP
jgi:cytochrome P450